MIAFQKLRKMFLISSKSSFRSRDIQIFVIFPLPLHTFQIQKNKWKWNNSWCHELALHKLSGVIFGMTPEPFYITASNLVR